MATTKTKTKTPKTAAAAEPIERTTKAEAFEAFAKVTKALGKEIAAREDQTGAWLLDLHRAFGGYRIHQIKDGGQGYSLPLGAIRLRPGDFVAACEMILCAAAIKDKSAGAKS